MAAFAAIERLDNVDYVKLRGIAESFGITGKGLTFFNVHICVEHFQAILESSEFMTIWNENSQMVKDVFNFIKNFQTGMWKQLSDAIFNYRSNSAGETACLGS